MQGHNSMDNANKYDAQFATKLRTYFRVTIGNHVMS